MIINLDWGYKISDGAVYYTQDLVDNGKTEVVADSSMSFKEIYCKSSGNGPVVVGINSSNKLYFRSIK